MLDKVKKIMQILLDNGYKAYLVGGCVRDMLLKIEPKDYDIATNALPDVVESLFEKTIPTGKVYGTITVMLDGIPFEVTTFRKDSEYVDERRPIAVSFSDTIEEDLSRRDFTINAIAMDIDGNIIDPYGGIVDLESKLLRCVGHANDRFKEDKLRVLRAFRFAYKYNLIFDDRVNNAIYNIDIMNLSSERIRSEIEKIIILPNAHRAIEHMSDIDLLHQIFPTLYETYGFQQNNPHHYEDVFSHTLSVLEKCETDRILRLAALFHDIGKPYTYTKDDAGIGHFYTHEKVGAELLIREMENLRYSNDEIRRVSKLVFNHIRYSDKPTKKFCTRLINEFDQNMEDLDRLFKLQVADSLSHVGNRFDDLANIFRTRDLCIHLHATKQPMSVKDLKVNGFDMMDLGLVNKHVGYVLLNLIERVISEELENERGALLEEAKRMAQGLLNKEA